MHCRGDFPGTPDDRGVLTACRPDVLGSARTALARRHPQGRSRPAASRRRRLSLGGGHCPVSPVSPGDLRRTDRAVAGNRSAAHCAAHRSRQPRLPVQRADADAARRHRLASLPAASIARKDRRIPRAASARAASSCRATAGDRSMSSRSTPHPTTVSMTRATFASVRSSRRRATGTRSSSSTRRTW